MTASSAPAIVITAPTVWTGVKDSCRKSTEKTVPKTGTVNMVIVAVTGLTARSPR